MRYDRMEATDRFSRLHVCLYECCSLFQPPVECSSVSVEESLFLFARVRVPIFFLYFFKEPVHFFSFAAICRIIMDIAHFLRVCDEVIHFPLVDVIIEMNQFAVFCSYPIMTLYRVFCRIFIIVVVCGRAPFCRSLAIVFKYGT